MKHKNTTTGKRTNSRNRLLSKGLAFILASIFSMNASTSFAAELSKKQQDQVNGSGVIVLTHCGKEVFVSVDPNWLSQQSAEYRKGFAQGVATPACGYPPPKSVVEPE